MDIKKINMRKNSSTLTGLVIVILLTLGFFIGLYTFLEDSVDESGNTLDDKYSSTFSNLSETQSNLKGNIDNIKDNIEAIREADNTFLVAWNGFKGLGNTLLLPVTLVTTGIETYTVLEFSLDFIPLWVKSLAIIGITTVIIFLILSILKGEPRL